MGFLPEEDSALWEGKVFGLLLFSSKSKIWAWPAADKLFIRGNAKAGVRAPNVEIWPLAFQSPR